MLKSSGTKPRAILWQMAILDVGPDVILKGVFARRLGANHEYFELTDLKLHDMSNNKVLATLRYNAKNKETGKAYNAQVAHLWTFKEEK